MKKYLNLMIVFAICLIPLVTVFASNENVCPDGDGWTKIDSGDLTNYPVAGATQYCFKAGNFKTNLIPEGGFGQDGACVADQIERCDLSHWSYYIPEETDTPEVTATPEVTDTPEETETQETFEDLILSVLCDYNDSNEYCHVWTVTNPNDFNVNFSWSSSTTTASINMAGYAESGSETTPANGTVNFNTLYVAQTMTIKFYDGEIEREVRLDIGPCEENQETTTPTDPTEETKSTTTPTDVPAGGLGPSAGSILFLATIGVFGLSLVGILIKKSIVS